MAEGEGVEGAGEEGRLFRHPELEGPALDAVLDDEAVDVGESRSGVEEGQLLLRLFVDEEENFLCHQGEEVGFFLIAQHTGAKQPLADDMERFLPHGLVAGGQTLQQEARHPIPPGRLFFGRLTEPTVVFSVMLQHGSHGGQCCRHHAGVGGGEQRHHLIQHLVQLPGGQPQGEPAQVFRYVLGNFRLPRLQGLGKLHGDLVPAVRRQLGSNGQQGRARHPADYHVFTDLDEVGEVGGDVEKAAHLLRLVQQVLHAHGLQHPGRGGLQIVQEHTADGLRPVQPCPDARHIQPQLLAQFRLQEQQRRGIAAFGMFHGLPDCRRFLAAQSRQQMAQQPQGGGLLRLSAAAQPPDGEPYQHMLVLIGHPGGGDVEHRVQQGEGRVVIHGSRLLVVAEQQLREPGGVVVGAVLQQGVGHGLGLVADHAGLPGGEPVVRVDEPLQILRPQLEGPLLLGAGSGVRRQLFFVAGMEARQNTPDQGCRLTADVTIGQEQQLIQKLQSLLLLTGAPVGEILLENGHIGPDAGRLLFAPGGLQDAHEQPLVAQAVHQADVVVHGGVPQAVHHLVRPRQSRRGTANRRFAGFLQGGVHAEIGQVFFKVPQLGVDVLIPQPLGVVHVVQLVQNDVKGFRQGVDAGDLPSVLPPGLLHPEVGIHQHQRLRGQVFDFKVPDGVVGGDAADGRQPPPGEPLVRIEIVEVGHPLSWLAAELADVVPGGGAGHQPQVDEAAPGLEGPGHGHGDMVDACDVLQGAEGRHLPAQPQKLVDVFLPEPPQKLAVFLRHAAVRQLLLRAEGKIQPRVKGEGLPLQIEQLPEELEEAQSAVPLGGGVGPVVLGKQQGGGDLIGVGKPALRGLGRRGVQQRAEDRQRLGAGEAFLQRQQGSKQPGPVRRFKQAGRVVPGHPQLAQEAVFLKCTAEPGIQRVFHGACLRSLSVLSDIIQRMIKIWKRFAQKRAAVL